MAITYEDIAHKLQPPLDYLTTNKIAPL